MSVRLDQQRLKTAIGQTEKRWLPRRFNTTRVLKGERKVERSGTALDDLRVHRVPSAIGQNADNTRPQFLEERPNIIRESAQQVGWRNGRFTFGVPPVQVEQRSHGSNVALLAKHACAKPLPPRFAT